MANTKGRGYTRLTLKKLFALSGNQCAYPDCNVTFLHWEDDKNLSNICHIEDANPDTHKADRYNPKMTDKQRADYENLILLCPNHHIETNNPEISTVSSLKKMKRDHEIRIRERLVSQNIISRYPSTLTTVVNKIGEQLFLDSCSTEPNSAPDPEAKISFNNIIEYKPVIESYKVYQGKLNKIYLEIEKQGSRKKEFVLKNINTIYLKEKAKYISFEDVKENADKIIKNIEGELWKIIEKSSNIDEKISLEAIQISLLIVIVDAFMRCDIFEEPK